MQGGAGFQVSVCATTTTKKKTAFNKGVLSRGFRRHLEPFFCTLRVSRDSEATLNLFSLDLDDFSARNYMLFRCGPGYDMEA